MDTGTLYWITGLSGSGKTTLAQLLYNHLKKNCDNIVFIDGDCLRTLLNIAPNYSYEGRKKASFQYSNICKKLTEQNINVVCATVSMFDEIREWNKTNINNYREIYLEVALQTIKKRDKRGVYSINNNVVGINIKAEVPLSPDVHLKPTKHEKPKQILSNLLTQLKI